MGKYNYWMDRLAIPWDILQDKKRNTLAYVQTQLARLTEMFEYDGLPETIEKRWLLRQFFMAGHVFVTTAPDGNLYSFVGGWGGEPNAYYVPTDYIIDNPYLAFNKVCKIGVDGVLIYNDSSAQGLLPILTRYCRLLAENDISLRLASINARRRSVISAGDDKTFLAAQKYLDDIEEGKLAAIGENEFLEGVKVQVDGSEGSQPITDLIELEQYVRATMYNEIGLNANYNMKRESINSNESQLNKDALFPLVDNMLEEQRKGWEAVNAMFGTNIKVRLSSAWKDNMEEKDADLKRLEEESGEDQEEQPEGSEEDDERV